jgi:fermentation-respiration switch protein FrsA (DUF1100 family)
MSVRARTHGAYRARGMAAALDLTRGMRAAAKTAIFFLKVYPVLPSRPVDWVTGKPVVERVRYPSRDENGELCEVESDLYRPSTGGEHARYPGIVVCLGVVPFGQDHPQVPRLGEALARSGFAALLYWSPEMRDCRLDPADIGNIALAYQWLLERPYVDPARSGLLGTCVGGSFALMAAASPSVRDRVAFLSAYAPYSSMLTLARDIASRTRSRGNLREPWQVDPLTYKVFLRSLTALLQPSERELLRNAFAEQDALTDHTMDPAELSEDGRAVYRLLTAADAGEAEIALREGLPAALRERLATMSPMSYLRDIHAPLIVILHDRDDQVVPVGESRRLRSALALAGRDAAHYTELGVFQHLDPTKGKPPLLRLLRELARFYVAVYPLFKQSLAS